MIITTPLQDRITIINIVIRIISVAMILIIMNHERNRLIINRIQGDINIQVHIWIDKSNTIGNNTSNSNNNHEDHDYMHDTTAKNKWTHTYLITITLPIKKKNNINYTRDILIFTKLLMVQQNPGMWIDDMSKQVITWIQWSNK